MMSLSPITRTEHTEGGDTPQESGNRDETVWTVGGASLRLIRMGTEPRFEYRITKGCRC